VVGYVVADCTSTSAVLVVGKCSSTALVMSIDCSYLYKWIDQILKLFVLERSYPCYSLHQARQSHAANWQIYLLQVCPVYVITFLVLSWNPPTYWTNGLSYLCAKGHASIMKGTIPPTYCTHGLSYVYAKFLASITTGTISPKYCTGGLSDLCAKLHMYLLKATIPPYYWANGLSCLCTTFHACILKDTIPLKYCLNGVCPICVPSFMLLSWQAQLHQITALLFYPAS
jgi:hypothetical protein